LAETLAHDLLEARDLLAHGDEQSHVAGHDAA
jgi:hypothetical protein